MYTTVNLYKMNTYGTSSHNKKLKRTSTTNLPSASFLPVITPMKGNGFDFQHRRSVLLISEHYINGIISTCVLVSYLFNSGLFK